MAARLPQRFTVEALEAFLIAPDASEALSPLAGPGYLVLDLDASPTQTITSQTASSLIEALERLPCVTVALGGDPSAPVHAGLRDRCDVVALNDADCDSLLEGFAQWPHAALAFVQLLRRTPGESIYSGLVAESFVYSTLQAGPEFAAWLKGRKRKSRRRRQPESERPCRLDRDRGLLEIRFARAAKHNAFSRALRDAFCEALQLAIADPSIEDVVLCGEGASFCSGGDLDEFGSFPDPSIAHTIRTTRSPGLLLSRLSGRIRSEVHGACIGAGIELPAFTDRIVASEDAFFALPEIRLGLVPGAGGTVSLPRRIGRQRTAWLGLSGERIDARTALAWGLIDEVRLGGPA